MGGIIRLPINSDNFIKSHSQLYVIPIKLSKFPIALVSWTKRQGEVPRHSRSYGEELQRSIFVQIASAIGNLESAIGIIPIKLSNPVMSMASWTKRQGEVTSHSRSYGEELQRSIFVQLAMLVTGLESLIGIT